MVQRIIIVKKTGRIFMEEQNEIKFHHVGIVVNTDNIKTILNSFFQEDWGRTHHNETQGVDVTFLPLGEAYIELIYPHGNTTIEKFLEKKGEAIHHFCFEVSNLDHWVKKCKKMGFEIVSKDDRCFFIHPKSFGGILVEVISFKEGDSMREVSMFQDKE